MRISRTDSSGGVPAAPFLVGLISLPAQALLCRELLARGGGSEIALTLYLALWLAGSALGGRLLEGERRIPPRALLIASPLLASLALAIARLLPTFGGIAGEVPTPAAIVLSGLLVLFPAAFVTAGLFPLAARGATGGPGRAYAIEAAGALVGGCATTALVMARVPPLEILALTAAAAVMLATPRIRGFPAAIGILAAAALLCLSFLGIASRLDDGLYRAGWTHRHPGLRLVAHAMTPTRSLALASREGERWLLADDAPREVLDDPYRDEATAALLIAVPPSPPRSALLVDFGVTGVARALAEAGVARVACLLPDREDTVLARPVPGISYVTGDPRRSLRRIPGGWDVVAIASSEGTSLAANRLWTMEAFRDMVRRLSPQGAVVAIAPGGDAAPGPEARAWRASVASALANAAGVAATASATGTADRTGAMGDGTAGGGVAAGDSAAPAPASRSSLAAIDADRFILVAARQPGVATLDPDSLAARYRRCGGGLRTYPSARFAVEYPRDRQVRPATSRRIHVNTDVRPAAFAYATGRWLRLMGIPTPPSALLVALAAALILAPIGVIAFRSAPSRTDDPRLGVAILLATGAASMGLDLLLLIAYQAKVGMLQGGLGVLLGAFLGGTSAGALLSASAFSANTLSAQTPWPRFGLLCAAQGILAACVALALPGIPGATILFALLAFLIGATCGAPFPAVSRLLGAGRAWGADALGGIMGALLFLIVVSQGIVTAGLILATMPALVGAFLLLAPPSR